MSENPKRRTRTKKDSDPAATTQQDSLVNSIRDHIDQEVDNLDNKTDTKIRTLEKRIDAIDGAMRGNGRVGYSEQIRTIKRTLWLFGIIILWLAGFEVAGVRFKVWLSDMLGVETGIEEVIDEEIKKETLVPDHSHEPPKDLSPDQETN